MQYQLQNGLDGTPVAVGIVGQAITIPMDPDNTDYQQYLKWLEEGNTPLPADPQPE
jgi:hypothetical protein